MRRLLLALLLCSPAALLPAQDRLPQAPPPASAAPVPALAAPVTPPTDYLLGAGDQLSLSVPDLEEEFSDKAFRVDSNGEVSLPLAGRIQAAGLTNQALEQAVRERLAGILRAPQVAISIAAFGSQRVSVLGEVNSPGLVQLQGRKTLFDVLSMAGGLTPDAGYLIKVTRDAKWGRLPLADAHPDPAGQSSIASVKVRDIISAANTADNIVMLSGDTISVPRADMVYAVGSVTKPGGFMLNQHETLSALQVVSLAQGIQKTAAADKAKILRTVPGSSNRTEIAVNLKQIMAGHGVDIRLQPEDILFVPNSGPKSAGYRTIDAIVTAATGVAIYGRY